MPVDPRDIVSKPCNEAVKNQPLILGVIHYAFVMIGRQSWFPIPFCSEQSVCEYYVLNLRIRDLLFHYRKGVILFQFYLVRVFKKKQYLSFRARANDVNSTESQPNVLCQV